MEIKIFKNKRAASEAALALFKEALKTGKETFGLATGSTPEDLYTLLRASDLDFSQATSVNLDEYVGLGAEDDQSYAYFMKKHLFEEKPFKESYLPDGLAENLDEETKRYDKIIEEHPIDLQLLGIGRNGHIGFNEPGTPSDSTTRVVDLTESTINANERFFASRDDVPRQAISMGLGSIMSSKKLLLMAFGEDKADAIAKTIEGEVTSEVPATLLQKHADAVIYIDEAAASQLKGNYDREA